MMLSYGDFSFPEIYFRTLYVPDPVLGDRKFCCMRQTQSLPSGISILRGGMHSQWQGPGTSLGFLLLGSFLPIQKF